MADYRFEAFSYVTPELSSLITLLSGVGGLGGMVWRRRR